MYSIPNCQLRLDDVLRCCVSAIPIPAVSSLQQEILWAITPAQRRSLGLQYVMLLLQPWAEFLAAQVSAGYD